MTAIRLTPIVPTVTSAMATASDPIRVSAGRLTDAPMMTPIMACATRKPGAGSSSGALPPGPLAPAHRRQRRGEHVVSVSVPDASLTRRSPSWRALALLAVVTTALAVGLTAVVVAVTGDHGSDGSGGTPAASAGPATDPSEPTPTAITAPAPAVSIARRPRITGEPRVGERLVARLPKGAVPAGSAVAFEWRSGGEVIATHRRFRPGPEMVGRTVRVHAVVSQPGFTPATRRSKPAVVAPDNPLADGPWAVYRGEWNGIYPAYQRASGESRRLLGKIALQPRVIWFAANWPVSRIGPAVEDFIAEQHSEFGEDALIQLAVFREWPRGEGGRNKPLSRSEQSEYRAWVDRVATAIGDARVAIVLEPDLGLNAVPNNAHEMRTADPAVRLGLVRYAAERLSDLPRTTVYLDASDSDWLSYAKIVPVLEAAGIEHVRGFALGATHYSSVADNIDYGAGLVEELAARGYPGKRFVIDTADNGRPFTWLQHRAEHPGADYDNAATCRSLRDTTCNTLGVPPTSQVTGHEGLGLTGRQERLATRLVDGYLWFGRPWLVRQNSPFSLSRSLEVARSTPFQ